MYYNCLTSKCENRNTMAETDYWVYILSCENDSYYTGYTTDLERRYQEHMLGTHKCKFTRSFKPINIAQSWKIVGDKSKALKIERYIKSKSKNEKKAFIRHPDRLIALFREQEELQDKN